MYVNFNLDWDFNEQFDQSQANLDSFFFSKLRVHSWPRISDLFSSSWHCMQTNTLFLAKHMLTNFGLDNGRASKGKSIKNIKNHNDNKAQPQPRTFDRKHISGRKMCNCVQDVDERALANLIIQDVYIFHKRHPAELLNSTFNFHNLFLQCVCLSVFFFVIFFRLILLLTRILCIHAFAPNETNEEKTKSHHNRMTKHETRMKNAEHFKRTKFQIPNFVKYMHKCVSFFRFVLFCFSLSLGADRVCVCVYGQSRAYSFLDTLMLTRICDASHFKWPTRSMFGWMSSPIPWSVFSALSQIFSGDRWNTHWSGVDFENLSFVSKFHGGNWKREMILAEHRTDQAKSARHQHTNSNKNYQISLRSSRTN